MKRIEVSECCEAEVIDGYIDNPADHHDPIPTCFCSKCKEECEVKFISVVNDLEDIISKDEVQYDLYQQKASGSIH